MYSFRWCLPGQHSFAHTYPASPFSSRPCHSIFNSTACSATDPTACPITSTNFISNTSFKLGYSWGQEDPRRFCPQPFLYTICSSNTSDTPPRHPSSPCQRPQSLRSTSTCPALWPGYVLPHCSSSYWYSPKPGTECGLLSNSCQPPSKVSSTPAVVFGSHAPPSPCQEGQGFCWWGEYPPTSKFYVAPSSMANTSCRLQTDGPYSSSMLHLQFFRQSQDLPPLLSVTRPTSNRHTSFLCCLAPPVSPLTPKGKLRHYSFESIIAIVKGEDHYSQEEQQSLIVTLQNITPQSSTVLDRIKDVHTRL